VFHLCREEAEHNTDVEFAKTDAAESVCHQHSKHKAAPGPKKLQKKPKKLT